MNKKGHVLNALLLSVGLGFVLAPAGDADTFRTVGAVTIPVVLGALFPDVDTDFGRHRKTLHNGFVLAIFLAFPVYFANLQFVWVGVLTHYVLDVVGSRRGIAFFYPLWSREYGFPTGVVTSSKYADAVTLLVTGVELAVAAALVHLAPGLMDSFVASLPFDPAVGNTPGVLQ